MPDSQFRVWFLFLAQVIVTAGLLHWKGQFEPVLQFDTESYRDYSMESAVSALNDKRTFVYPCVIRFFQATDDSTRLIPWFQYACSAMAAGCFLAALLWCSWNCWMALAAVSPILASHLGMNYGAHVTPDLLAQSFAIVVVSLWMIAVQSGRSGWAFWGLAITLFLTYQTKPSYLFLLAFVPIGGLIARWWLQPQTHDTWAFALRLFAASLCPFIAWCTLRWALVGHFGLVSFGGYNIIGITSQLLERDMIPKMSEGVRPLADEILSQRDAIRDWPLQRDYDSMETHFNQAVWDIAVPIASKLYDSNSRTMNLQMTKLSREILQSDPRSYARWLAWSLKRSLRTSVEITMRNPVVIISIPIMLWAFAVGWRRELSDVPSEVKGFGREFQWLVWTALGFAVCKIGLVVLVEPPIDRYCAPATVFFPSVIVMLTCRMLLRNRRQK